MPKSKITFPARRTIQKQSSRPGTRGPKRKVKCITNMLLHAPDYGTAERWQHATRTYETIEKGTRRIAARVIEECQLDALHFSGVLSEAEHTAGMQLRRDFLHAKLERPVTARYNPLSRIVSQGSHELVRSHREQAAYREWKAAMLQVSIHDMDVVMTLCCHNEKPLPKHMDAIHRGLDVLVRYFRIR
jgi:hypothetical protein